MPSRMTASCAVLAGSRLGSGARPKAEFEMQPGIQSDSCGGHLLQPAAQIGAEVFDFTFPDARDGGRQIVFVVGRHAIEHLVGADPGWRAGCSGVTGSRSALAEFAKQLELGRVEKCAARERVHLFQARGFFARAKLKDGVQAESDTGRRRTAAGRMANSCGWRDGARRRACSVAGSGSTMPSARTRSCANGGRGCGGIGRGRRSIASGNARCLWLPGRAV